MNSTLPRPDLTARPHGLTVERMMKAPQEGVYRAWTEEFDAWFAEPGMIRMRAAVDEPYVFVTRHENELHPHHGRFLTLEPHRLVELTWVTGTAGTAGAETVVTVELEPSPGGGTLLRLTHTGFYDQAGVKRHENAWAQHVLPHLDDVLTATRS
ncbi:SRPBCC family protein [Allosalinactinospora lopnorensis]|uniref:SRPBCC family protein n=1 Tax=Allosalinactinospora lopnorensis TaxID=1352348 RepID=UPI000623C3F2|nr:SRPBCC domain-containing protein [Allosalinactinospora lopnorensis]